jgi:fatty-acid desaturase
MAADQACIDAATIEPDQAATLAPTARRRGRIVWLYASVVVVLHLAALFVFLPWLFSWTGVALMIAGIYFFGGFGINMCYHRLLSHRSFACPVWLERTLVYIALCCMQDAPGRWVAAHRIHHKHADDEPDPHSPLVSFLWSHIGWLLVDTHGLHKIANYERYVRDLLRQPFYLNLERRMVPLWVYLAHAAAFFAVGLGVGWGLWGMAAGVQFGLSLLVWGVIARTVAVWHITWSVNSLTHMFGYRNYSTDEESRNNWFVAILTSGEGWHNNHHADPACACNRRRWWELDPVYGVIRLLERVGLAWDVVRPKDERRAARIAESAAEQTQPE